MGHALSASESVAQHREIGPDRAFVRSDIRVGSAIVGHGNAGSSRRTRETRAGYLDATRRDMATPPIGPMQRILK